MFLYNSLSDQDLTSLLKSGDERAFAELYQKFSQRIYTHLRKLLKDDQLAQELLQDTFVKIWEKRERLTYEISFRSYLYRISENLVRDFFRKASRDKKMLDHLIATAAVHENLDEDSDTPLVSQELFAEAIGQLPPQRRRVFTLCKIEGRSYEEVSIMLGISPATINDHIVKATKFVRAYLKSSGNSPMLLFMAAIVSMFRR